MACGRTTASFSPAMSATVGPSQRVCSRPTFVSTATAASSTLVASQRPPRPASTTATSTSRRASSSSAAAVSSSNWVTRSPPRERAIDLGGGGRGALHGGAEGVGREVLVADPDPLGEGDQVRREVGAGAHAVGLEQRGGHADGRALAVGPHDVDGREALLRAAERGQQAPHPLQPEAHAEQLEREQVLLGLLLAPAHAASSSSSWRSAASLSRSPCTTASGARATKRSLASLPSARAISDSSSARRCSLRRVAALEVHRVGGEHGHRPAGHADGRHRLAVAVPGQPAEPCHVLGRRVVALRVEARGDRLAGRGADAVPPRAQRLHGLDRARELLLGGGVGERVVGPRVAVGHQQAVAAGDVAPDVLGHERDQRMGERERLRQHVHREARGLACTSSGDLRLRRSDETCPYSRGLSSSRYQSHSSP